MGEIIASISNVMYSYILIIMLLGVGLYFTIRTKGVQLRLFGESIRVVAAHQGNDPHPEHRAVAADGDGVGNTHNVAGADAAGLHEEFGFGNKEDGAVLEKIIMLGRRYLKETEFTCTEHKKGE